MKIQNKIFITLGAALALFACKKNELRLTETTLPTEKAFVRFALYSPGTPSVMIKVNDVKVNGSTTTGAGGFYPSVANSPDYAAIAPNGNFKLSLPNTGTGNDSVVIYTGNIAINQGKFYSMTLADTGVDRTFFAIEDKLDALADSGFFKIRLINAMAKTGPIHLIRVDSTSATAVVRDTLARNIDFKQASAFIRTSAATLPGYSFLRFRTVLAATGQPLASIAGPTASAIIYRYATIYASGFANGTSTLAPALSTYIYNQ